MLALRVGALSLFVGFSGLTCATLLQDIVKAPEVDTNVISQGISIYFLLALLWAAVFAILELLDPGSFDGVRSRSTEIVSRLIYFSLTTITTLGYGDIHPVKPLAQSLAALEAASGVLFIAVFVARLVSLFKVKRSG